MQEHPSETVLPTPQQVVPCTVVPCTVLLHYTHEYEYEYSTMNMLAAVFWLMSLVVCILPPILSCTSLPYSEYNVSATH